MFKVPEHYRVTDKSKMLSSDASYGNNGLFQFFDHIKKVVVSVIASDGEGWEHCSITCSSGRMPSWDIMCRVKEMFWEDEDTVIQYHPKKSEYVNFHKGCLHLWRKIGFEFPLPDSMLVGPKIPEFNNMTDEELTALIKSNLTDES